MNKSLLKFLCISLFVLIAFSGCASNKPAVESIEFKILLKPENFLSLKKGCEKFWKVVEKVAEEKGVKTKKSGKELFDREICFLDTDKFTLYEKGFIFRIEGEA